MKTNRRVKVLMLISSIFFCITAYSQDLPPEELMPGEEEKVLIDVLLEISMFEVYFVHRASDRIDDVSRKNKWSEAQVFDRKKQISFKEFMKNINVYNVFSIYTKKELEELIDVSRRMNSGYSEPKVFFTSGLLESRIDSFIEHHYLN